MIYKRALNLPNLLKNKSFFLFGARYTGKTSLIEQQLTSNVKTYNLLDAEVFNDLVRRPKIIEEALINNHVDIIVIDEIQKLPSILDEVQRLITKYNTRFLLTGSSARKLKRESANLLAGRAWQAEMFPLVYKEIEDFNLLNYLNTSGLPAIYNNKNYKEELRAYVNTYLQQEIYKEALTRNLASFSSLLDVLALSNGQEINYESLGSDCGVSAITIKNYIEILSDTLIGFELQGYTKTKKRKAISRSKHYLFDIGVTNHLAHRGEIALKSEAFGNAFEHFIILEIRAWNSYTRNYYALTYWRSTTKFEVDLIIGNKLAIEIKSTNLIQDKHLKGLRALKEEKLIDKYLFISQDKEEKTTSDGIILMPWEKFLQKLWDAKDISSIF